MSPKLFHIRSMENKDLISKWLNGELSPEELAAFKKTADYRNYGKIVENASRLESPEFDEEEGLKDFRSRLDSENRPTKEYRGRTAFLKIAAVLIVLLASGVFIWLNKDQVVTTGYSEVATIELPDESTVQLGPDSKISYDPGSWDEKRLLHLKGEAYFKVQKGKKFAVETGQGTVTVLGTKFHIKNRKKYFEVYCYEGAVRVQVNSATLTLEAGKAVKVIDGNLENFATFDHRNTGWNANESHYEAVPLEQVIADLERQFHIEIEAGNLNRDQLFTGSFGHNDKELAIRSVSVPLKLEYRFETDRKVVLYEK